MRFQKCWHFIIWCLANVIPITFVYYFIAPGVKNTMGLFVDSLLKSANISQSTINHILFNLPLLVIVSAVGLLLYYNWHSFDFSIDKYGNQFTISLVVLGLLALVFLIFGLNAKTFWLYLKKIVISIVIWKMMSLTATYLTNKSIDNNILTGNMIKIIPIIISIFALINSYYH